MAEVLAPIPQVILTADFFVQFEAIDPTTGAAVSGVTVANAALFLEDDTAGLSAGGGTALPLTLLPGTP